MNWLSKKKKYTFCHKLKNGIKQTKKIKLLGLCGSQTQKQCANVIAYCKPCTRYGDFDT